MTRAIESDQSDGSVERQAQKDLTARLGAPLVRRSKGNNLKWSTWKSRLGAHRESRA
jgi:hypothetical protein